MTKNANFDILMPTATVGTKHQIVIPKAVRKRISGLYPGAQVSVSQLDSDTIEIRTKPENWVERFSGIASEAWKDIDTTQYLEKLRDEWAK